MTVRPDERAEGVREIDRFEGGVGWIAHPDERMQRASHVLSAGGESWVVDPVDGDGVDELLADVGPVGGVVVTLSRHTRDAAAVAARHEVPVYLPDWFEGVAEDLDAPVVRFGSELAGTGIEAHPVYNNRLWQEVALYDPQYGTLLVPESVGTAAFFLAGDERLGVHPVLRALPPRDALGGFAPERVLVGHGEGVVGDATEALREALAGARRRTPRLLAGAIRTALPF